ncbi:MAG: hypothetical protein ACTSUF_02160 [Candidatus Heimdallarchaeaceae archaeon]
MIPFIKVVHIDKFGVERDLTQLLDLTQKRGLQAKQTTLKFRLRVDSPQSTFFYNPDGTLIFNENDVIKFWLKKNSTINTSTDTPLIIANIEKLSFRYEEKQRVLEITGADKTALLLNKMFPAYSSTTRNTADAIIKWVIEQVADLGNKNYAITTTNVATTKHDGSPFKTIIYGTDWKRAYDIISELSQPQYTGDDRAYIFWVDEDNDLHWIYPSQTIDTTLAEGSNQIIKFDLEYSTRDMVNMIVFKCGTDKNGNAIYWYYFDTSTKSSKLVMRYENWEEITQDMQSATDPFDWSSATNDEVREEAKNRGTAKAQDIIHAYGNPRWKGNITLKGTLSYTAGNLIEFSSTSLGLNKEKLRIYDVVHNITKKGWTTTLEVDQDPEAIGASS